MQENTKQVGKLIMNKGLPRSGKSTWAHEFVRKSGNAVIVSRDELRKMLHNGKWSHRNEKITMSVQLAAVKDALSKGMVVIVDDTNLSEHHLARWENTAREMGAGFEIHHEKESDINVLIERDNTATEKRGADVIIKLALEHKYLSFPGDNLVVCDLDGTLCNVDHRRHLVRAEKKDWNAFFHLMGEDTMYGTVADRLREFVSQGKSLIFVSARPEKYRQLTETWLLNHNFAPYFGKDEYPGATKYIGVLMRQDNDTRDDTIVKQEILDRYLEKKWIHVVFDDRPKVIDMWRRNGLTVVDCGDGVDF